MKLFHARVSHDRSQRKAFEGLLLAYLKLLSPNNAFRFASTKKYLLEDEACVIATRNIPAGEVIGNLEGRRVRLSEAEHKHLVKEGKHFSVIDQTQYSPVTVLIAPACMLNHSCEPNIFFYNITYNPLPLFST